MIAICFSCILPPIIAGEGDDGIYGTPSGYTIGIVRARWLLNVRAGPWGTIIDGYKPGVRVKIIAREGDWYKIIRGSGYAYVHTSLIEVQNGSNIPSSTGTATKTGSIDAGNLNPENFGADKERYQTVFSLVEKFCASNKAYVLGAAHKFLSGFAEKSDCSGFVGQFIQKISALAGVKPVTGKSYPSSLNYKKSQYTQKLTTKVPPTNPRDLVKPGDVFVMNKGSGSHGHVGLFMGYNSAGQPLIAHSTPRKAKKGTTVCGKVGYSGVRIEVIPSHYAKRWAGVYRLNNMDQILDNLQDA